MGTTVYSCLDGIHQWPKYLNAKQLEHFIAIGNTHMVCFQIEWNNNQNESASQFMWFCPNFSPHKVFKNNTIMQHLLLLSLVVTASSTTLRGTSPSRLERSKSNAQHLLVSCEYRRKTDSFIFYSCHLFFLVHQHNTKLHFKCRKYTSKWASATQYLLVVDVFIF